LINSNLFQFIYLNKLVTNKDSTAQLKKVDLDIFPVRVINFGDNAEKEIHNIIAKNVDKIMLLNIEIQNSKLNSEINTLKREIIFLENKINKNIYKLYDLTPEEIEIIEKLPIN